MENFNKNDNLNHNNNSEYMENLLKEEGLKDCVDNIYLAELLVLDDSHTTWVKCLDEDGNIVLVHKLSLDIESIPYELNKKLKMEFYVSSASLTIYNMEMLLFPRTIQGLKNFDEYENKKTDNDTLDSIVANIRYYIQVSPIPKEEILYEFESMKNILEEISEDIQTDMDTLFESDEEDDDCVIDTEILDVMKGNYTFYQSIYDFLYNSYTEKIKKEDDIWFVLSDYFNLTSSLHNLDSTKITSNISLEELQQFYKDITDDNAIMLLENTLITAIDNKFREGFE